MKATASVSPVTKAGFTCLLLVFAIFAFMQSGKPLRIDTNLKDLSPQLTEDIALQHAVAKLSTAIENRFTLVVTGFDQVKIDNAARLLAEGLSAIDGVTTTVGEEAVTEKLIDQLAKYRFGFLTESQAAEINNQSTDQLVENATEKLYQLAGGVRLLPIDEDPFSWFTEYVTAQASPPAAVIDDTLFTAIRVTLASGGLKTSVQESLQAILSDLESQVQAAYPQSEILHSGVFFFAAEAARSAKKDIKTISTVSVIMVVTLLLLTFFSLRPLLLPFVSVATGIAFAFVVTYWIYGSIHILTIVFGASLIGIIIDYSLHYFYCHSDQASSGTHAGLLNAMKLSLVSSLIGYGALGFSDLVSLQKIALFSCAGLIAAWVTVLAMATRLMGDEIRINPKFLPPVVGWISRIAGVIALWPKTLCAIIVTILFLVAVSGINGNDNPRVFFNPAAELLREEQRVSQFLSNIEPGRYFVVRADNEDNLYARLDALYQQAPEEALLSIKNWLQSPQMQRQNYQLQKHLFQSAGAVEQFMQSIGLDATHLQRSFTNSDGSTLSARAFFEDPSLALPPLVLEHNSQLFAFVLITDAARIDPEVVRVWNLEGVDYIDIASMSSRALKNQREGSSRFLLLAFLLVAITLYVRYRNWSKLLMLIVPVTSISTTLLVLGLFGSGITLFHSMALFLVLGLGMDYVIFVSELQNEPSITLQAVFLSAITSLLSFGLLSLSSIPVVHAFGITVLVGNGLNLIGSMIYASWLQKQSALSL